MSLNGCLRCARYSAFAMSFIVWVSGMVVLIGAIYLRMDRQTNHVMYASYADDVTLYHVICYSLIGCGAVVTFIGFLGCCSAFQESRCMVAAFFAVLFALLTTELLIGAWVYLHIDEIKVNIPATMSGYVRNIYGKHALTDEPIDYVQQSMRCCGGVDVYDWSTSAWSNQTTLASRHHNHHFMVPTSCCVNRSAVAVPTPGFNAGPIPFGNILEPMCLAKHMTVISRGCGSALLGWIDAQLLTVAIVALCLVGLQFISLCASLILCCGMRRQSAGGYKT